MHFCCAKIKVRLRRAVGGNSPPDCCIWIFKSLLLIKITSPKGEAIFMAEKEGFEPSKPFWGLHDFQSCALGQLRDFSIELTRGQP